MKFGKTLLSILLRLSIAFAPARSAMKPYLLAHLIAEALGIALPGVVCSLACMSGACALACSCTIICKCMQMHQIHLRCCAGGLKPFSAMPAPPQTFLLGNLPDLTKGERIQLHLVLQRWAKQLGPIYR